MTVMSDTAFPTDENTLAQLRSSCLVGPGERSTLFDTLQRLSLDHRVVIDLDHRVVIDPPVSWSPHDVIIALVDEVRALRTLAEQLTFQLDRAREL